MSGATTYTKPSTRERSGSRIFDDEHLEFGTDGDVYLTYDEASGDTGVLGGTNGWRVPDDLKLYFGTDKDVWCSYDEAGSNVGVLGGTNGWEVRGPLTTTEGIASGLSRKVGGLVYASVAASTAITGATETETLFDTQISLPAGTLKAGTVIKVRAQGVHTATTGSETHSMILKIGSVALTTMAATDPANSDLWYFDAIIVCRTAGASGTLVATGSQLAQAATGVGTAKPFFLASTTIDTTAANIVGVAIDRQGTATDSDSARLDILTVEVIG